jgi:hypothetical protein
MVGLGYRQGLDGFFDVFGFERGFGVFGLRNGEGFHETIMPDGGHAGRWVAGYIRRGRDKKGRKEKGRDEGGRVLELKWRRMTWLRRCLDTNGTGQLIGDLAAVLEKYECHSPRLIQLHEHKHGCGRRVKFSGLFNFLYGEKRKGERESQCISAKVFVLTVLLLLAPKQPSAAHGYFPTRVQKTPNARSEGL